MEPKPEDDLQELNFEVILKENEDSTPPKEIPDQTYPQEEKIVKSIFEKNSNLDLSTKRLQNLIQNSDISTLLKESEKAFQNKRKNALSKIKNLSPRSGQQKKFEIEKWATLKEEKFKSAKKDLEEAVKKTE